MSIGKPFTAIASLTNTQGLVPAVRALNDLNCTVLCTHNTAAPLRDEGVTYKPLIDYTNFPEIMDGRLKTLHPLVEGGILLDTTNAEHVAEATSQGIVPISLVLCNFYNFQKVADNPDSTYDQMVEAMDIGGPTMIMAAAKNYTACIPLIDPDDYMWVIKMIADNGDVDLDNRNRLQLKAIRHVAEYRQSHVVALEQRATDRGIINIPADA